MFPSSKLQDCAGPLSLLLINNDAVTMVTPAETTADLYVTRQLQEAASVCYLRQHIVYTIHPCALAVSSTLIGWRATRLEESPLIGCSDWGCTKNCKEKKKVKTSEAKNVCKGPPLLQLTGENKERKALETKRHTEEEEGRCET